MLCLHGSAQHLLVESLHITGEVKTKEVVILRELDFSVGDTIGVHELAGRLERNRGNLLNTSLFTEVDINIKDWDTEQNLISIAIVVKEAWYLYLVPIVELADRNFNVWWKEHNAAFDRINLGIRAYHINFSGMRDRLKAKGQLGYTRKLEAEYELPFFNKKKTLGMFYNVLLSANKELAYRVENNKEVFYPENGVIPENTSDVLRRFKFQAGLQYRANLYSTHEFEASFHNNWIAPQIAEDNNPDFFLDQKSRQTFFGLRYRGTYDNRDLRIFPMQGWLGSVEVMKEGIGVFGDVNSLQIVPAAEYYIPLTSTVTLGFQAKVKYSLIREKQPFSNYQGLGYGGDFLRGYQLYVINGLDFIYGKSTIKAQLLQYRINWKRKLPKAFRIMDVQIFGTLNYDIGYVNDPFYAENNPLVNQTLFGWGPGVGVVLYHMLAIQIEYNMSDRGENGIFVHTKTSF